MIHVAGIAASRPIHTSFQARLSTIRRQNAVAPRSAAVSIHSAVLSGASFSVRKSVAKTGPRKIAET